jgi:hypothetical protein
VPAHDALMVRCRAAPLALVAAAAIAISGCAPPSPAISDPREILAQATQHLTTAKTGHFDAVIDGTLSLAAVAPAIPGGGGSAGGFGGGAGNGSIALTGTHASGDLDLAAHRAAIKLEVPALLGLTAELRAVDAGTYLSSSLTARGWHRLDAAVGGGVDGVGDGLGAIQPLDVVAGLEAWLARPGIVPTRLDDANCAAGRCYVVRITGSGADFGANGSGASGLLGSGLTIGQVTAELRIARDTLRLSEVVLAVDTGTAGSVTASVTLTAWDSPVSIASPPANEIVEGPLLP